MTPKATARDPMRTHSREAAPLNSGGGGGIATSETVCGLRWRWWLGALILRFVVAVTVAFMETNSVRRPEKMLRDQWGRVKKTLRQVWPTRRQPFRPAMPSRASVLPDPSTRLRWRVLRPPAASVPHHHDKE
jgi:hypothetical protein